MTKVRVMKCQTSNCNRPSSWKAGTWEFCDEHIGKYIVHESRQEVGSVAYYFSVFGTAYRFGMYCADKFVADNPHAEDMTVFVSSREYKEATEKPDGKLAMDQ